KRVILAFALSIAVMYAFSALYKPTKTTSSSVTVTETPPTAPASAPTPESDVSHTTAEEPNSSLSAVPKDLSAEKAEDSVFSTPLYTATISNVGGVLKSYHLKAYSDGEGRPLELINDIAGTKVGWPLALVTGDKTI